MEEKIMIDDLSCTNFIINQLPISYSVVNKTTGKKVILIPNNEYTLSSSKLGKTMDIIFKGLYKDEKSDYHRINFIYDNEPKSMFIKYIDEITERGEVV